MNSIYEGFGEAAEYVLKHTVSEIEKYYKKYKDEERIARAIIFTSIFLTE